MIDSVVKDKMCTGCYSCKDVCVLGAISLMENEDGFRVAQVNKNLCAKCGKCREVCPILHQKNREVCDVISYAFRAEDTVRKESSSGGVVSLASQAVIKNGGCVCGVELDSDMNAKYIIVDNYDDLKRIQGSKYLQADASGIYRQVRKLLEQGKKVLFTGLPCHVAALYNYINDCHQENLFTIDLLCHGTPSDKVVRRWIEAISDGRKIQNTHFRMKKNGWTCNTLQIDFQDGSFYKADISNDYFEKLYHYNVSLRDSCYTCEFAEFPRIGDLSIGDFHGMENCLDVEDDHKGTSIVFINNNKGERFFEGIRNNAWIKEVPIEASTVNRIHAKIDKNPCRERFFRLLREEKYDFKKISEMALEHRYDIGVVGIPTVENHGSNLSYYALYRSLKQMGYEVLMIERPRSAWWGPHETPVIFRENPYDDGDLCELFDNRLQMQKVNQYADTFILGSDQLWYEGLYECFDKFCFLDYINQNKNKITYAASFGRSQYGATSEEKAEAAFFIQGIDSISVRERTAVDILRTEWNVEAEVVLDPVFLCSVEEYIKLAEKAEKVPYNHYIATYILDPSPEKQSIIERIAEQLELPIINMTDVVNVDEKCAEWNLEVEREVSNEDWLARIRECDFFITDSFHGSCFAIIFEKEFMVIGNVYRGIDRFQEILSRLKLESRLIFASNDIRIDDFLKQKIDWNFVGGVLEKERKKSLIWLSNAINKKKQNQYSLYDMIQKEMMVCDEQIRWQKSVIDEQGNVIGAHDEQMRLYDMAFRQLQEDAQIKQIQMKEFQDAIISLREMNARLLEESAKVTEENARLSAEIQQLKDGSRLKRAIRKFFHRNR